MKFKSLFIIFLLNATICLSQSELAKMGIITLANNDKIAFNNIRLQDGKFVYFDVKSASENSLTINEIKYIEDERESKIFTNKTVVDKSREADVKYAQEQKKLSIETEIKKAADYKLKLENEKKTLALGIYPNGVYTTKEDFINKIPTSLDEIIPKEVSGFDKSALYGIPDDCFFYYLQSDKKVKNSFAISYRGNLYFQVGAILNNRNKTDRAQTNDHPNAFTRVISGGQNYYYVEVDLVNAWAQGFAYNAGVGGAMLANSLITGKGIVWDVKNQEFNIFKNCNDYNEFIKDKYPDGFQECSNQQPNIVEVRKAIEIIK